MAAPTPTPGLSPSARVLRSINVFVFFPGLAFCIATATTRGDYYEIVTWPLVGLAPLSLSAVMGFFMLVLKPRQNLLVTCIDVCVFGFLMGIDGWGFSEGYINGMIGGMAASALLVDVFIHLFFILTYLWNLISIPKFFARNNATCARCPHCLSEARARKTSVKAVGGGKETYHRVPGRDDGTYDDETDGAAACGYSDARPSVDDETARLV